MTLSFDIGNLSEIHFLKHPSSTSILNLKFEYFSFLVKIEKGFDKPF